jgi:putative oxidoreductase
MLPNRPPNMDVGLLALRLGIGFFLIFGHGWGKLTSMPAIFQQFPDPIGLGSTASALLAIFAEVFCSLALILGLFTRLAAIPLLVLMLVAIFFVHSADPWNVKELAVIYMVPYLALVFTGGGRYALDALLFKGKSSTEG